MSTSKKPSTKARAKKPTTRKTASAKRISGADIVKQSKRPTRVPVNGNTDILTVLGKDPEFVYRWITVNSANKESKLTKFKAGGYEHVDHDVVVGIESIRVPEATDGVVTRNVGGGDTAYLMRIRRDWYEEDQAAKQHEVDLSEADITSKSDYDDKGRYGEIDLLD